MYKCFVECFFNSLCTGVVVVPSQSPAASPLQPQARVVVTELQAIDDTNEEVKELLDADMGTVEECIRAIELYGTAIDAFPHMMESQEMGALFQESGFSMLPTSQKPQPPAQEIARFVKVVNVMCTWSYIPFQK